MTFVFSHSLGPELCENPNKFELIGMGQHLTSLILLITDDPPHILHSAKGKWLKFSTVNLNLGFSHRLGQERAVDLKSD